MRLMHLLLFALLLGGCSLPRVIVLNDPLDARQHNDLGVAYQQRGEYDLAVREYDRAAELARDWALPVVNRGNAQGAAGDWKAAEKSYRLALRREPENAEAMNNLAWSLLQGGEADAALVWAERAVSAAPDEPAVLDTLAELQLARGDLPAARAAVEKALALDPGPSLRGGLEGKRARLEVMGVRP